MNWFAIAWSLGCVGVGFILGFVCAALFTAGKIDELCKERDWAQMETNLLKRQKEQN